MPAVMKRVTRLHHETSRVFEVDYVDQRRHWRNTESKIKQNKQLPLLVSNVVEAFLLEPEEQDEGVVDLEEQLEGKRL